MIEHKELICVNCPMGCTLDVTIDGETVVDVSGHSCKRGAEYAQAEISDPRRMVASTAAPFPRPQIFDLLAQLREVELKAPVEIGQIVLRDVLGTGVNVLASRDLPVK